MEGKEQRKKEEKKDKQREGKRKTSKERKKRSTFPDLTRKGKIRVQHVRQAFPLPHVAGKSEIGGDVDDVDVASVEVDDGFSRENLRGSEGGREKEIEREGERESVCESE